MPERILLSGGRIMDGSGAPSFSGDVLVTDGRIERILPSGAYELPSEDMTGIDCSGKVICPGFIDSHSHNDWFFLREDRERFFDPLTRQGVTTLVVGNCGYSASGFDMDTPYIEHLGGNLFSLSENDRRPDFRSWLDAVDGMVSCNVLSLAGHGTARLSVAGPESVTLTDTQEKKMLQLLESALKDGAAGISLGLEYAPGLFAPTEELEKVAKLCADYDRILTVHARASSAISLNYKGYGRSHLLRALDELDSLVRKTSCRFEYSHLIFVGRRSWSNVDEAVSILEKLNKDGFKVGFDMYPYDYGASIITVVLPAWYMKLSKEERKKPPVRLRLRMMVALATRLLGFGFADIRLAWPGDKYAAYTGKSITEIAKAEGRKPFDVYIDICEGSDFKARVLMSSYQNDEIVDKLMRHPLSIYMSDAWFEEEGIQNDALTGAFLRFLKLGREKGIALESTIHKMTGQAAERFQIKERGLVREGYNADLVVLDPETVTDEEGSQNGSGIEMVLVNGITVYEKENGLLPARTAAGKSIAIGR